MEEYRTGINPPMTVSPCGHVFCDPCLQIWRRQSNSCPNCRGRIQTVTLNRGMMEILESTPETNTSIYQGFSPEISNTHSGRRDNEILYDKSQETVIVLDNSGSMINYIDGVKFSIDSSGVINKKSNLTRWQEACFKMREIMDYNFRRSIHASYYLLNPRMANKWEYNQDFLVVKDTFPSDEILEVFFSEYNVRGRTPLSEITNYLSSLLKDTDKTICYNVITDGLPDNRDSFERSIKKMSEINQIFMVINLCTNDDQTIAYYNDLDTKIGTEISGLDVIDDFEGEYQEVVSVGNDFIVYSYELHICRMAGCFSVVADLLDEEYLGDKLHYVQKLCNELMKVNCHANTIKEYANQLQSKMDRDVQQHYLVYDFRHKDFRPIVNLKRLRMGKMGIYLNVYNLFWVLLGLCAFLPFFLLIN